MPDLIVVGDVMVDVGVEAGALALGGDVHGEVRLRPGGGGANAAVWAASEGAGVRLYGRVGDDLAGRLVRESLEERGVEVCLALDPAAPTGTMLIVRDGDERSMVADRGANGQLSVGDLPDELEAAALLVSGYLLFAPGSREAGVAAIRRSRAEIVAVDAASWPLLREIGPERFFESTSGATLLLANEREAEELGGAAEIRRRYPMWCVKLGPNGAELTVSNEATIRVSAADVGAADTTGAGDAFDGVLLSALARHDDRKAALQRASAAGARVTATGRSWP
jgi:sugar/nucleoside kinase (ribokinase family)